MNTFQRYLAEEFAEDYQEGRISRRDALKLIASVTGSALLANTILTACTPSGEQATAAFLTDTAPAVDTPGPTSTTATTPTSTSEPTAGEAAAGETPTSQAAPASGTVNPDDPEITSGDIQFPGEGATLLGYQARPSGEGSFPVILVCHENRGLTEHIMDVARRLAKAGYVALAVDLLSRQGGTTAVGSDNVPSALGNIPPEQFVQDFKSAWRYLQGQPFAQAERVGMVGFCFGGGVTWLVATRMPELKAAVPYYGPHPPVEEVQNIQAAVLAIYAGNDQRINQGIPPVEEAMQQNGKTYQKIIYPDTEHAFHNDTGPRYNAQAAQDAWQQTLAWFEQYV